jgi:molybdopterin synthase catalytic subunit
MDLAPVGDDWVLLTEAPIGVDRAASWIVTSTCGAAVTFAGTVRDHSEGREGVSELTYEAYAEQVKPRLLAICAAARDRWPELGRTVIWHRIGRLELTEASVICAASSPHRPEAFHAARFLIDTVKATVPIWKRETWQDGSDWSLCDHEIDEVELSESARRALEEEIDRRAGVPSPPVHPEPHR